jgi:uncharacterized membrane protein YpjA
MAVTGVGQRIDRAVARRFDSEIPEPQELPRYAAPLPEWLENVGLRLAWVIVAVNLAGTGFGFYYYHEQLLATPVVMWPIIPVSPLSTLLMALSLAAWRLGYSPEWLHALAFFGNIKYGLWTVFVQVYVQGPGMVHPLMWQFLIWSHAAMAVQAFLIHRYSDFTVGAVAVATGWFALNDVFDYFLTVFGGPHHTWITAFRDGTGWNRDVVLYDHLVAVSVTITVFTVFLALATRVALLEGHLRTNAVGEQRTDK